MESKQIVDGVNVSECEFCDWKGSDIPQCRIRQASFEPTCKGYNCYYKQLAREKRECAYWKKANDDKNKLLSKLGCPTTATAKRQEFVLQQQIDQLKEELKEQKCGLRPELKRLINKICRKYDIEAKTYHEKIVEIIHSLDDYNQALIDIEEILKQGIKIHDDIIVSKQILQKAREVENEG